MSQKGQCLCKSVQLTIDEAATPLQFAACYCLNCSTTAGSPFSMITVVDGKKMKISGETKSYADKDTKSGRTVTRVFCPNCGTPIVSKAEDGTNYVKLGLFSQTVDKVGPPVMTVFEENRDQRFSWLKGTV